jgi:hypothetical protein
MSMDANGTKEFRFDEFDQLPDGAARMRHLIDIGGSSTTTFVQYLVFREKRIGFYARGKSGSDDGAPIRWSGSTFTIGALRDAALRYWIQTRRWSSSTSRTEGAITEDVSLKHSEVHYLERQRPA